MLRRTLIVAITSLVCICIAQGQTAPSTGIALPEGPLKIKITGIQGRVQARTGPDQKWEAATEGMELSEGAELRTGPKSAVRFMIGDDQTITLDRLGTIQILRADFASGKVFTDLGMKYGRTRYDIESAAREHDAKVRSPSSVLAVRGTVFIAQDEAPFPARAVSLEGRVMFRDTQKLVAVGGKGAGKAKVDTKSDSSAATALKSTLNNRGNGSSQTDLQQSFQTAGYYGAANVGVTALFDSARLQNFAAFGTIGPIVPEQLFISLNWGGPFGPGAVGSDVDLAVKTPEGDVIDKNNKAPQITGFPVYQNGPPISDPAQPGTKAVGFSTEFRGGTYTVTATLADKGKGGTDVGVSLQALKDPNGTANDFASFPDTQNRPLQFNLNDANPTQTRTFDAQPAPQPALSSASSKKKSKSTPPAAVARNRAGR
jgi:hypothetical protein